MLPCDGAPVLEKEFELPRQPGYTYSVQVAFEHNRVCHATLFDIEFEFYAPPETRNSVRAFER